MKGKGARVILVFLPIVPPDHPAPAACRCRGEHLERAVSAMLDTEYVVERSLYLFGRKTVRVDLLRISLDPLELSHRHPSSPIAVSTTSGSTAIKPAAYPEPERAAPRIARPLLDGHRGGPTAMTAARTTPIVRPGSGYLNPCRRSGLIGPPPFSPEDRFYVLAAKHDDSPDAESNAGNGEDVTGYQSQNRRGHGPGVTPTPEHPHGAEKHGCAMDVRMARMRGGSRPRRWQRSRVAGFNRPATHRRSSRYVQRMSIDS